MSIDHESHVKNNNMTVVSLIKNFIIAGKGWEIFAKII